MIVVVRTYNQQELYNGQRQPLFIEGHRASLSYLRGNNKQIIHTESTSQRLNSNVKDALHKVLEKIFGGVNYTETTYNIPCMYPSCSLSTMYNGKQIKVNP